MSKRDQLTPHIGDVVVCSVLDRLAALGAVPLVNVEDSDD